MWERINKKTLRMRSNWFIYLVTELGVVDFSFRNPCNWEWLWWNNWRGWCPAGVTAGTGKVINGLYLIRVIYCQSVILERLFLILQVIYALGFHNEAVGRIVACEQALHFQWKTRRAIRERVSERQRPACRFRVSFRVTCARGFHEIPQRRWPL